jgi:ComF family protein
MQAIRAFASDLLDLIAPATCAACYAPHPTFPSRERPVFCAPCAAQLEPAIDPPTDVRVPYEHGGSLASAIHHAKYGDHADVAHKLGRLLREALAELRSEVDLVVPVPLHRKRLAKRGYNQAAEMAAALGLPVAQRTVLRVRDTRSQVGLHRADRQANVREAFVVTRPRRLEGRRVLVVDDVVTTGATIGEVARVIRAAGATDVQCAALACAPLETHARW